MRLKSVIYSLILLMLFSCSKKNEMTAVVNAKDGLIVRSEPSVKSSKIDFIPSGTEVVVLDKNGPADNLYNIKSNWFKVKFNDKTGWAFGGFLEDSTVTGTADKMIKLEPVISSGESQPNEKTFHFNHLNTKYTIDPSGNLFTTNAYDTISRLIKENESINTIFYKNYKDDIILVYEVTDSDGGWSKLLRLNCSDKTCRKVIDENFGGFNLSAALAEDRFIYLSTIGFIGKASMDTGKFAWEYNDLYKKYKFNDFEDITLDNQMVYFTEGLNPPKDTKRRKIEVNKITGKIEKIIDL